jgi:dolichol-phosphate mannosyltransferase
METAHSENGGLSLVIPAWNEEDRLPRTLDRYLPVLEESARPFEVIVVSDGGDRTAEVARRYLGRGVRVLESSTKLGKGGAVLAGMRQARYDFVGYLDADGPIPPHELLRMVHHLSECDAVVASRWVRGARVLRQEPLFNRFAGRLWNILTRSLLFLNLKDTQCGAKFFRRSVILPALRAIALTNRAFDVDLLYHLNKGGHSVREVPVTWSHDPDTRMPIAGAIPLMFVSLIGVRVMNLPLADRVPREWVRWAADLIGEGTLRV